MPNGYHDEDAAADKLSFAESELIVSEIELATVGECTREREDDGTQHEQNIAQVRNCRVITI